jgi:hypothetical protein
VGDVGPSGFSRRRLLGGGVLLGGAWVFAQVVGHWPLGAVQSPCLGSSARRTLEAFFETVLPEEADSAALADGVDDFLAAGDPVATAQLVLALGVLEHMGGAGPLSFRRFSRLPRARRAEVYAAWRRSRVGLKRQIAGGLRKVAVFTWYSNPQSWAAIGYDGPRVGR